MRGKLAATAAVMALLGTALGGAAIAAPADPVLKIQAQETYYVYEHDQGPPGGDLYRLDLNLAYVEGEEPIAEDVKLTIDASALKGLADLKGGSFCTEKDYVFTCEYSSIDGLTSVQPFYIKGAKGAKPGDSAVIKYTATASNADTATAETKAVIGGPKLNARTHAPLKGVEPGSTISLTGAVANRGTLAAPKGIGVKLSSVEGLKVAREHSNCHYKPGYDTAAYCTFDTPVEAGKAYEFSAPFAFKVAEDQMYGSANYHFWALGSGNPWQYEKPEDFSEQGSGPPLTLKETAAFDGNGGHLDLATTQRADYQAIGGTIEGKVGSTAKIELGVRNAGPGTMDLQYRDGHGAGTYEVTPPEGTTITKIPFPGEDDDWACSKKSKKSRTYVCTLQETFAAGEKDTLIFYVRIDKKVKDAEGKVQALAREDFPTRDAKPENDAAPIELKATGSGGGTGSGGADGGSGDSGGSEGSDGSSAGTSGSAGASDDASGSMAGTGSNGVLWILAAAAAALGLGAVAVALTRRRSSRER
ncbi:hypothetical protein G5C51_40355 [Streptomyces sp. A7024]|uniref:Peptidase n=1 Tax=Streptomyces coryli TaxID=1128680 RepID=A0A6G4UER6_9ACTN|nr:hypothetical protein [Streptomyces coryli]NGN70128.1 hypothetical protein [Streptomyces coryli]